MTVPNLTAKIETGSPAAGTEERRPLRVCMIVYSFYMNDSRVRQYATALADRGDEVDVFSLRRPGEKVRTATYGRIRVHFLQERQKNERNPLDYAIRLLRFFILAMIAVSWTHRKRNYDVIHVHSIPDTLVFTTLLPRLLGVPVILDIHDILPEFYASKFGKNEQSLTFKLMLALERISVQFANHVIVANDIWCERIAKRCRAEQKCSVIRNYPDLKVFRAKRDEPRNGRFVMVYPGSLNKHQGLDIAVRAFARVAQHLKGAEFHIYGEGPEKPALQGLVEELDLEERIMFHEFLPVAEIVQVMANADLAVVPKRASNGFGNEAASTKILEFMSLGVPVVVTRTKIDCLYFNEDVVRFFESDNDADLAANIEQIYSDHRLRRQLASNGFAHAMENCWSARRQDYLGLVDSLVSSQN